MTQETDTKDGLMSGEFINKLRNKLETLGVLQSDGNLVASTLKKAMETDELPV